MTASVPLKNAWRILPQKFAMNEKNEYLAEQNH